MNKSATAHVAYCATFNDEIGDMLSDCHTDMERLELVLRCLLKPQPLMIKWYLNTLRRIFERKIALGN